MSRLYNEGEQYFYETGEEPPFVIPLDEDHIFANIHREQSYIDRIGILDDRDGQSWLWFRESMGDEKFNEFLQVVMNVGTVMLRTTALTEVENQFWARQLITDDEINDFFEAGDGQA